MVTKYGMFDEIGKENFAGDMIDGNYL